MVIFHSYVKLPEGIACYCDGNLGVSGVSSEGEWIGCQPRAARCQGGCCGSAHPLAFCCKWRFLMRTLAKCLQRNPLETESFQLQLQLQHQQQQQQQQLHHQQQ